MPELPEVEVTKRGIENYLTGHAITEVYFDNKSLREPFSPDLMNLEGSKVKSVTRRAKYIVIETNKGYLLIHLGMTGHLRILPKDSPLANHDHFYLSTDDDKSIIYNDIRRFGMVLYYPLTSSPYDNFPLKELGPEPFSSEFNVEYLLLKLSKLKKSIKQAIMDNAIVVGIGNIYASEILFRCRINPKHIANSITKSEAQAIIENARKILSESIEKGGTTIRDFSGADGKLGYFVQNLYVYGHEGEQCKVCGTKIEKIVQGQRSTFYCPCCQK